jgi:UDP-4-amino-4,6-dideoxy-N-acetyl-beta-L-altrosamine transaminase|tara:strand:+ start:747 stop:1904 length:1158 start_codon:yes stop_codon:yes gene_type:complete
MIPYGKQNINQADIDSVIDVLQSDFLTQGPQVPLFEKKVSDYCDSKFGVAVNSASSALHIACLALGLERGDWLWTSANTFIASSNCALHCGAQVDFVDIDPRTFNMSVECLAEKLVLAEKEGKLPKIVIPVHMCGQSCDMAGIHELSQKYGFKIIEDASHAIGGKYKNKAIGSCHYSDISVFSYHPVKIITTGEGGMALTNNPELADRMQRYRCHGITSDASRMQPRPAKEIWNYQQIDLGFNYRMTDIHAALGLSQMNRLDKFVAKRHAIASEYEELLSNLPVTTPWQHPDSYSAFHLYIIRLKLDQISKTQRDVFSELYTAGIGVNLHYIPVYRQPYYEQLGFKAGYCPEAERYYAEVLSLPLYFGLTKLQQDQVVNALMGIL